jgi:phosphoribosylanthranilate isomerase
MKVKICGITNLDDALLCQTLGADVLGFILYPESKRYISPEDALKIIENLSPFTMKIGVFVNESSEKINGIASKLKLNAVQLHGNETPEIVSKIKYPVIKSFRIKEQFDFSVLHEYKNAYYLLDSFSKTQFGGTGIKFNWNVIPDNLKNKIILAGGVSVENIEEIFNTIKPAAVDLSSSLEYEPGKKNKDKVTEFFRKFNSLCIT